MAAEDFKFDVAFSFLAEDEEIATQINDLLENRIGTFLYSKRQEEIAGTDGEQTFNKVFEKEARIVFVLYRENWGKTSWTRIEETAIRNRGFEEGYDFAMFAPLDSPPQVPKWLPKNRMWVGLERWGIKGAAAAIEAKVQEANGKLREETLEDKLRLKAANIEAQSKNTRFLDSKEGVEAANQEIENLYTLIRQTIEAVFNESSGFRLYYIDNREFVYIVYGESLSVSLRWRQRFYNTTDDSILYVRLFQGNAADGFSGQFGMLKELKRSEFQFGLNLQGNPQWELSGRDQLILSTDKLAEYCLDLLTERIKVT